MNHGRQRSGSARTISIAAIALMAFVLIGFLVYQPEPIGGEVSPASATPSPAEASPPVVSETSSPDATPTPEQSPSEDSEALTEFLKRFDKIKSLGFIKTMRPGSTGIGYTLETLLELEENNDRRGDFLGMEIKAYRDREASLNDSEKMNLFLKEPKWLDGLRSADRIRKYGYIDDNGRTALYSTVTVTENSHGFRFEVDEPGQQLFLTFRDERVGVWTFEILQKRLTEKHTEAVFVAAESRGKGKNEEFRYHTVTWCHQPSVNSLIRLIKARESMLELRMHVKENGSARNHGSAFRVHKDQLRELYETVRRCR